MRLCVKMIGTNFPLRSVYLTRVFRRVHFNSDSIRRVLEQFVGYKKIEESLGGWQRQRVEKPQTLILSRRKPFATTTPKICHVYSIQERITSLYRGSNWNGEKLQRHLRIHNFLEACLEREVIPSISYKEIQDSICLHQWFQDGLRSVYHQTLPTSLSIFLGQLIQY